MLQEYDRDSDLLIDKPFFESESEHQVETPPIKAGQKLDSYQLQERLGEGGMGEVWAARQQEPVQRQVAIKLIRPGMETPGVLQRFDIERQALAAMDHPGIAKIFDAGTTNDRRPYFVMELINGGTLINFCDESRMSIDQRLRVFLQVVAGVQHAHQKAVIHRDLKPSNVLVTVIDGQPTPKIIDFGLAKALAGGFGADAANTHFGAVMGTLQYMAPEQAGYSGQDVDIRTDVYSLGIMLYELLTGLPPFDPESLSSVSVDEKLRMVKEVDPPLPSTRLSSSDSALKNASLRQTAATDLSKMLKTELDWIVMKAIQKDRRERYQSAGELASDIQFYLSGEPVSAHPPSRMYRTKKYVRRNKGLVAAIGAIAAALLLGIAGTTYGLILSNRNADLFKLEAQKAKNAELVAVDAAEKEKRQRELAESVTKFVRDDILAMTTVRGQFDMKELLGGVSSASVLGKDVTLEELLDHASEKIQSEQTLAPLIAAEINGIIGVSYMHLSKTQKAIEFIQRAVEIYEDELGEHHEETISAMNSLTIAYDKSG
ncbi:MAG: serine/threonine-protein kinase [Planctomycetota bacterium]